MRRLIDYDGRIIHVVPVGDLIEHATHLGAGLSCICGPKAEAVTVDDPRTMGVLVVHNSLDGREHDDYDHDQESCPLCVARASGEIP